MDATVGTGTVSAFKVYTAWGPQRRGFALDDPAIGLPVSERARDLGVKVMCAHKGLPLLGFDRRFNGPRDMVAAAVQYPDMEFVVYHSAYERETVEGSLFGLDPEATRCALLADGLEEARLEHTALVDEGAIPTAWHPRGPATRRDTLLWPAALRRPWTP